MTTLNDGNRQPLLHTNPHPSKPKEELTAKNARNAMTLAFGIPPVYATLAAIVEARHETPDIF
jgi:hypothetical protein